ncbi:hypothetical protein AMTRI_Chr06g169330 [Amborella trichopoda]
MIPNYLAPFQDFPPKPTVFLDLDEILIKSFNTQPAIFDFKMQVHRQPLMLVFFTTSIKEYVDPLIDMIDRVISHRLYRDSCGLDLSAMGCNMRRVIIIDDKPSSFSLQKDNGIQVSEFLGDPDDKGLFQLFKFFEVALDFQDMWDAAACYLFGPQIFKMRDLLLVTSLVLRSSE